MITDDKRIRIITGHYGSGKSEFSMNYITKLRELVDGEVAIADLDVVNVYFRTREKRELLESKGITVIDSSVKATTQDLPSVSPQIASAASNPKVNYLMDVGGDSVGARVLGRFSHNIKDEEYDMFFVINANREKTTTPEEVIEHIKSIEETAKLKVTGLINNTHLVRETTIDDVLKGQELAKKVSSITNIPIKYVVCLETLIDKLPQNIEGQVFPIKLYMRDPWM